ncbi:phage gene 29 protein family protein [Nocardia australiensis]|uniref:phage gene 29 protein family protein n=1 Tax=Nocardia australiensis TaxID=2887191 RepID=UPI001D15E020|nr:hypothetical protein [Nocardia australiensis]
MSEDLFGPNATQVDMLMQLLDAFPGQRDGISVPIHPKARRPWAEALVKRGVRVHPELMESFPIPGDHPEAGWMNPSKWVPKAEYEKHATTRPSSEQSAQQMKSLLGAIDPAALKRIEGMSDAERHEEAARQAPMVPDMLARLNELRAQLDKQQKETGE